MSVTSAQLPDTLYNLYLPRYTIYEVMASSRLVPLLLPAGRVVVLENELRSHPEPTMGPGMSDNFDLGQPALRSFVGLIEMMGAVHEEAGMAILDQPIVQR